MENYLSLLETANEFIAKSMFRRMKPPFEFKITCEDTSVGKLFYLEVNGDRFGGSSTPHSLLDEHVELLVCKSWGMEYPKEGFLK